LKVVLVASQLIISEPTHLVPSRPYEFIVVNAQTTTSEFHQVV